MNKYVNLKVNYLERISIYRGELEVNIRVGREGDIGDKWVLESWSDRISVFFNDNRGL